MTLAALALRPHLLMATIEAKARQASQTSIRLAPTLKRRLDTLSEWLTATGRLFESFEPKAPLKRGFALVWGANGHLARLAGQLSGGEGIELEFADGRLGARIDGEPPFTLKAPS